MLIMLTMVMMVDLHRDDCNDDDYLDADVDGDDDGGDHNSDDDDKGLRKELHDDDDYLEYEDDGHYHNVEVTRLSTSHRETSLGFPHDQKPL